MCKQKYKHIFIVIKYENINITRTKQNSGTRLYFKLMLNILKIIGVLFLSIPIQGHPFRDIDQESFHGTFHVFIDQGRFFKNLLTTCEL